MTSVLGHQIGETGDLLWKELVNEHFRAHNSSYLAGSSTDYIDEYMAQFAKVAGVELDAQGKVVQQAYHEMLDEKENVVQQAHHKMLYEGLSPSASESDLPKWLAHMSTIPVSAGDRHLPKRLAYICAMGVYFEKLGRLCIRFGKELVEK
jgi:hypothetical protein